MQRRNGLQPPFHPLQMLGWGYTLAAVGLNAVVVRGVLSIAEQCVFLIVYAVLEGTVVYVAAGLTISDPTDPVVYQHRHAIEFK